MSVILKCVFQKCKRKINTLKKYISITFFLKQGQKDNTDQAVDPFTMPLMLETYAMIQICTDSYAVIIELRFNLRCNIDTCI